MAESGSLTVRKVHAIKINLQSMAERSVIVWPDDTAKLCIQMMNGRRTWFTVQRGDSVILNGNREFVNLIELYRVFPANENGREVRSAWQWLNQMTSNKD